MRPTGPPIRGHIRQAGFRRVSHGLFLPELEDAERHHEFLRELEAWLLVLPEEAVFTHVTAARLRGWQLPALPEQVPVFAAVSEHANRPRRPGLICSRLVREPQPERVANLPVEPAHESLLRAARDLGVLDMVILIDSARRLGDIDEAAMRELLQTSRPGVRVLRTAWELSDPRAASAGETVLRLFDVALDVDVRSQAELVDEAGNRVGIGDLLVLGTRLVHEYDGAHHRTGQQHTVDLRRERALAKASFSRRGFTLDDLLNHPGVLMHEIDGDLGRRHDGRRLQRWRKLVGNSLYSELGRRRVMNRWKRAMGIIDWSRTA